jgi:hypothetical protein
MRKYWVTKYALSRGIYTIDGKPTTTDPNRIMRVSNKLYSWFSLGKDCFETAEEAIAAAEKMRSKKIKSLNDQAKKIASIDFERQVTAIED